MLVNGDRDEARERAVNETLDLIDKLDVDQARSLLRCFAIDEENFDSQALATVDTTVRATCQRSGGDYDALCHFPNGEVARLNREHLLEALAASAEAERVAQEAVDEARREAQARAASENIPDSSPQDQEAAEQARTEPQASAASEGIHDVNDSTTYEQQYEQMDGAAEFPIPGLEDLDFEKTEIRRLIRDGHVTINHYYMNKTPESQQENKPESKPENKPEPEPEKKPEPEPEPEPKRERRARNLCIQCNRRYFEKDNVVQEDGRGPCRYHTGQVVYYGRTREEAWNEYGIAVAGEAWNCCRRRRRDKGCHPAFHEPA